MCWPLIDFSPWTKNNKSSRVHMYPFGYYKNKQSSNKMYTTRYVTDSAYVIPVLYATENCRYIIIVTAVG